MKLSFFEDNIFKEDIGAQFVYIFVEGYSNQTAPML